MRGKSLYTCLYITINEQEEQRSRSFLNRLKRRQNWEQRKQTRRKWGQHIAAPFEKSWGAWHWADSLKVSCFCVQFHTFAARPVEVYRALERPPPHQKASSIKQVTNRTLISRDLDRNNATLGFQFFLMALCYFSGAPLNLSQGLAGRERWITENNRIERRMNRYDFTLYQHCISPETYQSACSFLFFLCTSFS